MEARISFRQMEFFTRVVPTTMPLGSVQDVAKFLDETDYGEYESFNEELGDSEPIGVDVVDDDGWIIAIFNLRKDEETGEESWELDQDLSTPEGVVQCMLASRPGIAEFFAHRAANIKCEPPKTPAQALFWMESEAHVQEEQAADDEDVRSNAEAFASFLHKYVNALKKLGVEKEEPVQSKA